MTTQSILTPTIPTPTAPLFPRQGEWTFEHWLRFPKDGWKYEIIDGVLYMTPPPAIAHQDALGYLFARMRLYAEEKDLGKVLSAPCGVRLSTQPVPVEPDILFVRKKRLNIIGQDYVEGTPDLIVEIISKLNGHYDRKTKFALYQEAGVTEYWLVDYQARIVEIYTLTDGVYMLAGRYTQGDVVASGQLSGFEVTVASLFNA